MRQTVTGLTPLIAAAALACFAPAADAQVYEIRWHTIDGGGEMFTFGGAYALSGTIGQLDAGMLAGGDYELAGGFWPTVAARDCAADFNGDGVVDTRDVLAFLNAWAARDPSSDCDHNGIVDTRDVLCFLNLWTAGC